MTIFSLSFHKFALYSLRVSLRAILQHLESESQSESSYTEDTVGFYIETLADLGATDK